MRVGYLRLDARARGNAYGGDGIRAERAPRKQLARTGDEAGSLGRDGGILHADGDDRPRAELHLGPGERHRLLAIALPGIVLARHQGRRLGELLVEPRGQRIAPQRIVVGLGGDRVVA